MTLDDNPTLDVGDGGAQEPGAQALGAARLVVVA